MCCSITDWLLALASPLMLYRGLQEDKSKSGMDTSCNTSRNLLIQSLKNLHRTYHTALAGGLVRMDDLLRTSYSKHKLLKVQFLGKFGGEVRLWRYLALTYLLYFKNKGMGDMLDIIPPTSCELRVSWTLPLRMDTQATHFLWAQGDKDKVGSAHSIMWGPSLHQGLSTLQYHVNTNIREDSSKKVCTQRVTIKSEAECFKEGRGVLLWGLPFLNVGFKLWPFPFHPKRKHFGYGSTFFVDRYLILNTLPSKG